MSIYALCKKEVKVEQLLKESIPSKESFTSNTDFDVFSKKNPLIVEDHLRYRSDYSIVGVATSYLCRFMTACYIEENKDQVFENLYALNAFKIFKQQTDTYNTSFRRVIKQRYNGYINALHKYVHNEEMAFETVVGASCWLAYLDYIYTTETKDQYAIDAILHYNIGQYLYDEVELLGKLYFKSLIQSNLIKPNSKVVFQPVFGVWSLKTCGVHADLIVDGILYDFNCTKNIGWHWNEIAQMYACCLLQKICLQEGRSRGVNVSDEEIKGIAMYHARAGLINTCMLEESDANLSEEVVFKFKEIVDHFWKELHMLAIIENLFNEKGRSVVHPRCWTFKLL